VFPGQTGFVGEFRERPRYPVAVFARDGERGQIRRREHAGIDVPQHHVHVPVSAVLDDDTGEKILPFAQLRRPCFSVGILTWYSQRFLLAVRVFRTAFFRTYDGAFDLYRLNRFRQSLIQIRRQFLILLRFRH
jgi:hypothetical protein